MMKIDEKTCHLKNDKAECVLLYHCLNDENSIQIMSPGENKLIRLHVLNCSALYLCLLEGKKLD